AQEILEEPERPLGCQGEELDVRELGDIEDRLLVIPHAILLRDLRRGWRGWQPRGLSPVKGKDRVAEPGEPNGRLEPAHEVRLRRRRAWDLAPDEPPSYLLRLAQGRCSVPAVGGASSPTSARKKDERASSSA